MNEREFWIRFRRGMTTSMAAIQQYHPRDPFWLQIFDGLQKVVRAIEVRERLPRSSRQVIGGFPEQLIDEPPLDALAQSLERTGPASAIQ